MIASKFTVSVLLLALFLGGCRVENAAACYVAHDTRVIYLMAQLRMAVGDREGGLKLMRRVSTAEHQKSQYRDDSTQHDVPGSQLVRVY